MKVLWTYWAVILVVISMNGCDFFVIKDQNQSPVEEIIPEVRLDIAWTLPADRVRLLDPPQIVGQYMYMPTMDKTLLTIDLETQETINIATMPHRPSQPQHAGDRLFSLADSQEGMYLYSFDLEGNWLGGMLLPYGYGFTAGLFVKGNYLWWTSYRYTPERDWYSNTTIVRFDLSTYQDLDNNTISVAYQDLAPEATADYEIKCKPSFHEGRVYFIGGRVDTTPDLPESYSRCFIYDEVTGELLSTGDFNGKVDNWGDQLFFKGDRAVIAGSLLDMVNYKILDYSLRRTRPQGGSTLNGIYEYGGNIEVRQADNPDAMGRKGSSLYKFNTETLKVEWYYLHTSSRGVQPQVANGVVYALCSESMLLVDDATGKVVGQDSTMHSRGLTVYLSHRYKDLILNYTSDGLLVATRTNWTVNAQGTLVKL